MARLLPTAALAAAGWLSCSTVPAFAAEDEATPTPTPAGHETTVVVEDVRTPEGTPATASHESIALGQYSVRAVRTGDVLERLAGVDVLDNGGAGQGSFVRIRGAAPAQVLVLVDGVRMNPIAGGGADLDAIPLELFERVDVTRGAGAARFGADALGGVVSFRSDPLRRASGVTVSGSSYGTFRVSAASIVRARWTVDAALRYERAADRYAYRDGLRDETRTRRNVGAEIPAGSVGVHGALGGGTLRARAWGASVRAGSPGLSEQETPDARRAEDHGTLALRWDDDRWTVESSARAETLLYENPEALLGGFPVRSASRGRSASAGFTTRRALGAHATFVAGADARGEWNEGNGTGRHARRVAGAHGEATAARGGWTGAAAMRVETLAGAGGDRVAALPSAGIAWANETWTLRAHGGRAWRIPTFTELYLPDMETQGGNPDLRPEDAWTADAGATMRVRGVSLSATAFGSLFRDGIVFAPVSATRFVPVNTGDAWIAGVEAEAVGHAGPVELRFAWTHIETLRVETGEPLPGRPRDRVTGRIAAPVEAVTPFVEASWTAASYVDFFGNLRNDGGEVVSAGVTAQLRRVGVTLEGTNLTDSEVRDARYLPQPGRALWLTLQWRGAIP